MPLSLFTPTNGRGFREMPDCAAGELVGRLAVLDRNLSIDEEQLYASGPLERLFERRLVAKRCRVKYDNIREITGFQIAALGQMQNIGWQARGAANRLAERQHLAFDCVETDFSREATKR